MLLVWCLLSVLTISFARPNQLDLKNVITVPPNCPSGQEWINGQCRDVWLKSLSTPAAPINAFARPNQIDLKNVITVPPNCPSGQEWINGQCRDVWLKSVSTPAAPINVDGNENDNSGVKIVEKNENPASVKNIISVPTQCPVGYKADALGICRPILDFALI